MNGRRERIGGGVVECTEEIAQHFQGVLHGRLGHEPGNGLVIPDENDFLLIGFHAVHNGAEVSRDLGDAQRFHRSEGIRSNQISQGPALDEGR